MAKFPSGAAAFRPPGGGFFATKNLPTVAADRHQLEQVLQNPLDNALQ